jgi:asparagine synthase (glutamine-hydrolysing)
VRESLVSDVPLGCFLSGGVDSTAVGAAARAEGGSPETLTIAFAGGDDESREASATAAKLGLPHRREECTAGEMLATVAAWPRLAADPFADPSLAPTWVVSRRARERWTVALSGDGGDEVLGGYPRLRYMPRLEALLRVPRGLRRVGARALPSRRWAAKLEAALAAPTAWSAYQALQGVWPTVEVGRLLGRAELPLPWPEELLHRLEGRPSWQRYRLLDLVTFLPERVLAKVDRASMSCSLEVRVPLLDHRLVEAMLRLPRRACEGKAVLREMARRLGAPEPPRRKRGFEVPLAAWLRGPLRKTVRGEVLGATASDLGLDRIHLRRHWEEHQSGRFDHSERLLAVTVLVRWMREWGVA